MKSGSLKLLEPSGPVLACIEIALKHHWARSTITSKIYRVQMHQIKIPNRFVVLKILIKIVSKVSPEKVNFLAKISGLS
jgi:hypothetical protein